MTTKVSALDGRLYDSSDPARFQYAGNDLCWDTALRRFVGKDSLVEAGCADEIGDDYMAAPPPDPTPEPEPEPTPEPEPEPEPEVKKGKSK